MKSEEKVTNAYDRLVDDLNSGELTILHLDLAVMKWIRNRKDLPEGVKNLLVQYEGGGLVRMLFKQIKATIGNVELAYRRGEGIE